MLRALATSLFAAAASILGVVLIPTAIEAGIGDAKAWWEMILGVGFAIAVSAIGAMVVARTLGNPFARLAEGWVGMFIGRRPKSLERGAGTQAFASLLAAAILIVAGYLRYRQGIDTTQLGWALQGVFAIALGIVFGVAPAIPALWFGISNANRPVFKAKGGQATTIVVAASLSFGIAWGVGDLLRARYGRSEQPTLPYGEWLRLESKAVQQQTTKRSSTTRRRSRARRAKMWQAECRIEVPSRGRYRIEAIALKRGCTIDVTQGDAPAPGAFDRRALIRAGVKEPAQKGTIFVLLDGRPDQVYRARLSNCGEHFVSVRLRREAEYLPTKQAATTTRRGGTR